VLTELVELELESDSGLSLRAVSFCGVDGGDGELES
jgi:hypothetical protein